MDTTMPSTQVGSMFNRKTLTTMALYFPWLITKSQQLGLGTSRRWTVEANGAYMYEPFALNFDIANMGYANPQKYHKDDPRCFE